jgi:hypothetical protein
MEFVIPTEIEGLRKAGAGGDEGDFRPGSELWPNKQEQSARKR